MVRRLGAWSFSNRTTVQVLNMNHPDMIALRKELRGERLM